MPQQRENCKQRATDRRSRSFRQARPEAMLTNHAESWSAGSRIAALAAKPMIQDSRRGPRLVSLSASTATPISAASTLDTPMVAMTAFIASSWFSSTSPMSANDSRQWTQEIR